MFTSHHVEGEKHAGLKGYASLFPPVIFAAKDVNWPSAVICFLFAKGRPRSLGERHLVGFTSGLFVVWSPQNSSRALDFSCGELQRIYGSYHALDISGSVFVRIAADCLL